jgi:hypothetical protein
MKRIFIFLTLLAGTLSFLTTCTYRANDANVCFGRDILPIFVKNCGGCHGSSSGGKDHEIDLTNYDGIMLRVVKHHPLRSDVYTSVNGNNPSMPPDGHKKLTSREVFMIKAWISMGAPNTTNCSQCDTSAYKFSADVQPIFNSWCTGACHTTSQPDGGFDLSNYNGIKACGQSGKLMNSINHTGATIAMPQGGSKLDVCDIQKIQNWVNAGYPGN